MSASAIGIIPLKIKLSPTPDGDWVSEVYEDVGGLPGKLLFVGLVPESDIEMIRRACPGEVDDDET